MARTDGNKWGNLSIVDGGLLRRRQRADIEFERALRALFVAMCGKDGKSVNKNFRNVARGHVTPWRVLMRRFREAKAARNDAHNYPLMKQTVRVLDSYIDALHGKDKPAA